MAKRIMSIGLLAVLFVAALTLAAHGAKPTKLTWSGVVTDPACGDPYTLYNKVDRTEYVLDGADLAAARHVDQSVVVTGTLEGNTIHVQSIR
jgi:hypothetical protein